MGQYYVIVNLDSKTYFSPGAVNCSVSWGYGIKLTEHTHFGSAVVRCAENLIAPGGSWHKGRLVWAGDYADDEPGHRLVCPDGSIEPINLFKLCEETDWATHLEDFEPVAQHYRYVLNHDTTAYVDLNKARIASNYHPLALLTVEGNGRGGGDYYDGEDDFDSDLIGTWARARVSVQNTQPDEGFTELKTHTVKAWAIVGHLIELRLLVQKGRASAIPEKCQKTQIMQHAIAGMKEALFREVLTFLLY